ncbi:MAG TPA: L-2-hydroxyglutarate oxidase [Gemmatimonadales bacterium]|nr:L-2-hydroxyglutarate oxidase [Gemmatimonadales bacterium]
MTSSPDVAILGGGIVGLATAVALVRRGASVAVLEAEPILAAHQTGHNSGVIHSGLYYKPGSLKAQTCIAGREALYRFCIEEGIPHRRCGKLVVATHSEELPMLESLRQRGLANGLKGLEQLGPREIRDREPEVTGLAGLWVEETGVVDFAQVAAAYARVVERAGSSVRTNHRVTRVRRDGAGLLLDTTGGAVRAAFLVGCAGLQADRVARACGLSPDIRIVPFRGEYYEVVPDHGGLVRGLIYPVPDPAFPFLGVHFTRGIDDRVEAGPNAVLALKREDYAGWGISLRDAADILSYPGFWRLAGRHWRAGLAEMHNSLSKAEFVRSLQRLVPNVRAPYLVRRPSGVRAQAVDRAGRLVDDFRFVSAERMLHVLNAPSPAATASLSIGERIAAQIPAQES